MTSRRSTLLTFTVALLLLGVSLRLALHRKQPLPPDVPTAAQNSGPDPSLRANVGRGESPLLTALRGAQDDPTRTHRPGDWAAVQAEDLESYLRNLRAMGCPEVTIRDILMGELNRQFAARRARFTTPEIPPFWQKVPPRSESEQQLRAEALRALDQEKVDTIRRLLGVDPEIEQRKNRDGFTYNDNRLGHLNSEQQDQVSLVREEYNQHWRQIQAAAAADPASSPDAVSEQLRQLDQERLARLAMILTPEELAQHELQTSWTSIQLRERLAGFQPSEAEFRVIYGLQKPFDDEFVHWFNNRTDPDALLRKQQAQAQLEVQLRALLGESRYAEYLHAQRPNP